MNLIQVQEQLKGLPTQAIMAYANGQNPEVPPYVALAELNRRKQLEKNGVAMQSGQKPTIKDQVEQSVGLMGLQQAQQQQAMQQVAQNMPQQGIPQGAPQGPVQGEPEGFAGGGAIAFNGEDKSYVDDLSGLAPDAGNDDDGGGTRIPGVMPSTSLEDVGRMLRGEPVHPRSAALNNLTPEQKQGLAQVAQNIGGGTPKISPEAAQGLAALAENIQTGKIRPNTPNRFYTNADQPANTPPESGNPFSNDNTQAKKQPVPNPDVVAKKIAQGKPATAPSNEDLAYANAIKTANEIFGTKRNLSDDMATAAKAIPQSEFLKQYIKELEADRARVLEGRKPPESWVNNQGLMAVLRGFAQANPRHPLGAASAAGAAYDERIRAQREAEDKAYREGLMGLSKADQERLKEQFSYATELQKEDRRLKSDALKDILARQNSKESTAAHLAQVGESTAARLLQIKQRAEERGDKLQADNVNRVQQAHEAGMKDIYSKIDPNMLAVPEVQNAINMRLEQHKRMIANMAKQLGVKGYEEASDAVVTSKPITNPAVAAAFAKHSKG